jgi:hypothetical protein
VTHPLSPLPVLALVALGALAPFQCGTSDPGPGIEDTPGEALYRLAEEFEAAGDRDGQVRVLRHLIAWQPKSRFARTAHDDLVRMGVLPEDAPFPGPVPPVGPPPP